MNNLGGKKLESAIRRRELVKILTGGKTRILTDYRLSNHVKPSQIDDVKLNGTRCKMPAVTFFKDKAKLLLSVTGAKHKKPFNVVLFDSFIVIEVLPTTPHTEFLVLIPNFESQSGFYVVGDNSMTSTTVYDTADVVKQSGSQAQLLAETESLLTVLQAPGQVGSTA